MHPILIFQRFNENAFHMYTLYPTIGIRGISVMIIYTCDCSHSHSMTGKYWIIESHRLCLIVISCTLSNPIVVQKSWWICRCLSREQNLLGFSYFPKTLPGALKRSLGTHVHISLNALNCFMPSCPSSIYMFIFVLYMNLE